MKLYVVTCQTYGCPDCGDAANVVGVFDTQEAAEARKIEHEKTEHFHGHCSIKEVELNVPVTHF